MDRCAALSELLPLRKLVLGGHAPLLWDRYSSRQTIVTAIFSSVPGLATISVGVERWERGRLDRVGLGSAFPEEWKDQSVWKT